MKHKKPIKSELDVKRFRNAIEDRKFSTSMDGRYTVDDTYKIAGADGLSRIKALLNHLKSKQDMIILQEILGPPKSLQ